MMIDTYFEKNTYLLEKIFSNDGNFKIGLIDEMVINFQSIKNHELYKLASWRELSFNNANRKNSFQRFQKFLNQITILPNLTQSYLLAISTFSCNGYIRNAALNKLTKQNKQFALPFILMRLLDWVPEVRSTASKCLKVVLWDCRIPFLIEFGELTNCLFFRQYDLHWVRQYFFYKYLSRQTSDDLYQCLRELEDNEKAYILWEHIALQKLGNPLLFNLSQKSKYARVRNHAFSYIPFEILHSYEHELKKLPNCYVKPFIEWAKKQVSDKMPFPLLENIIINYLYRNDSVIRFRVLAFLKVLKKYSKKDVENIYRIAFQNGKINPGVIRGLGETGNLADDENIIKLVDHPRAKIRGALLYTLYMLHYPDWQRLAIKLLNDKSYRVRKEVFQLLKSAERDT